MWLHGRHRPLSLMGRCLLWLLALCQWFAIPAFSGSTMVPFSLYPASLAVCIWRAGCAHSSWIGNHASCDAPVSHYCLPPPLGILVPVGVWRAYIGACVVTTSCPHSVGVVRRRPSRGYIRLATTAQHQLEGRGDHLFLTLVNYKVTLGCFLTVMPEHWLTESIGVHPRNPYLYSKLLNALPTLMLSCLGPSCTCLYQWFSLCLLYVTHPFWVGLLVSEDYFYI